MDTTRKGTLSKKRDDGFSLRVKITKDFKRNNGVYLMLVPVILYYLAFHYGPMYGAQIAFRDFEPVKGLWASKWVGFENFISFFNSYYFVRLIRNTVFLSAFDIMFGFPAPIILALLLNEVRNAPFKKIVQTVSYLPHFISTVVICGMIINFTAKNGLVNQIIQMFGGQSIPFLSLPQYFRPTYITTNIWQSIGWNSIIYLAAISNIDQQLYEAAR
jgi:putative aldouronate transport system permease protein